MHFSKLVFASAVLFGTVAGYAFLTVGGTLRELENAAAILDNKPRLTILDLPEVRRLSPNPIYRAFSDIQHFESYRAARLYERIADENPVVLALSKEGVLGATMRESDMALLVLRADGVAIFTNTARPGEALRYARRVIAEGQADAIGFTSAGNPYLVKNGELRVQACASCDGNWHVFSLVGVDGRPGQRVAGYPNFSFVHELPERSVALYFNSASDDGAALYFLQESQPPAKVRLTSSEANQPNPTHGLAFNRGAPISVAPLVDAFRGFIAIADRNSILIAGRAGTSIFVSHDPGDVALPGVGFEAQLTRQSRWLQIKSGDQNGEYKSGQFCHARGCLAFPIAFAATDRLEPDSLVLDAYSMGGELFIEAYSIQDNRYPPGSGRSPSYCLRIARMVGQSLEPVTLPAEQRVDCARNSGPTGYVHSRDAVGIDLEDPYLSESFDWLAVNSNPQSYWRFRQESSIGVDATNITPCARLTDGTRLNNAVVYSYGKSLAIRCQWNLIVVNEWGPLKKISIDLWEDKYPLFLPTHGAVLAVQIGTTVTLYDRPTIYEAGRSVVNVATGVPNRHPWATFASENGASLTWIEGSELVALTYRQDETGTLRARLERAPLESEHSEFGHFSVCGNGFWYSGTDLDIGSQLRPDWYDPTRGVVLVAPASPICKELGAPVFAFRMGEAALPVGGYVLLPEIRSRAAGSRLIIRRPREGPLQLVLDAFYSGAVRND